MTQLPLFDYNTLSPETRAVVMDRTGEIKALVKQTAQHIIAIGKNLCEVKAVLPHGQFSSWLETEFDWTQRTAQRFISVALAFKNDNLSHLQIAPSALYVLASPKAPEAAREEAIDLAYAGEPITHQLAKDIVSTHQGVSAEKVLVDLPEGIYRCIVIDPPWEMQKSERKVRPYQVGWDYPTMTEAELMDFPLSDFAALDSHLYLWTTHKHLPFAFQLVERWGFKYQCLMTWIKNVGFSPFSWMYSTEHVLFCRKGNLPLQKLGERLDFEARVREHSRKPDEFYELVKGVSPSPRIDVFSRERRDGFDSWGNEPDKYSSRGAPLSSSEPADFSATRSAVFTDDD